MYARYSYLSHLQCSLCQHPYNADQLYTTSWRCSRPLLAQYDLTALARDLTKDMLASREATMWRYHELLPVRQERHVLTLGEGMTPLLSATHLAPQGLESKVRLLVKYEGQNPIETVKCTTALAA
jgi:threonine synthase